MIILSNARNYIVVFCDLESDMTSTSALTLLTGMFTLTCLTSVMAVYNPSDLTVVDYSSDGDLNIGAVARVHLYR